MKIVDLVGENKSEVEKKKIHLVSCLQDSKNRNGEAFFGEDGVFVNCSRNFDKITRVANNVHGGMDLILLERTDNNAIFLGYWNDGIAEPNNEVIDNFGEVKSKVPIELVSCLQSSYHSEAGVNFFYEMGGTYSLQTADSITRVSKNASNTRMDLIILNHGNGDAAWLGHWNDGVI